MTGGAPRAPRRKGRNNFIYNPGVQAVAYRLPHNRLWLNRTYETGRMELVGNVMQGGPLGPRRDRRTDRAGISRRHGPDYRQRGAGRRLPGCGAQPPAV